MTRQEDATSRQTSEAASPDEARSIHRLDATRTPLGRHLAVFAGGLLDGMRDGWSSACSRASNADASSSSRAIVSMASEARRTTCPASRASRCTIRASTRPLPWAASSLRASRFMQGDWSCDELALLVHILLENEEARQKFARARRAPGQAGAQVVGSTRANTRRGSRRNIEAHYDLGNAFFEAFLDPTLTYSCGIFESPDATMEMVGRQVRPALPHARPAARRPPGRGRLRLGGFALHAASRYGCRVTSTTISKEQFDLARERVAVAGLEDQIEIVLPTIAISKANTTSSSPSR